jgi:potassium large conductance calcium-activated channel subfamily M alpha member 1
VRPVQLDTCLLVTQSCMCVSIVSVHLYQAYFNVNALTLIRTLITGGATPELEQTLAEGVGMIGGTPSAEAQAMRHRCRVTQIALYDGPFADFGVSAVGRSAGPAT